MHKQSGVYTWHD